MRRISGDTFSVKDEIKKRGGRWDPETKSWFVPIDFDDSIVPEKAGSITKRKAIHCGFCHQEGHRRDQCTYTCFSCGAVRDHMSENCPTDNPNWKRLVGHGKGLCSCTSLAVCKNCACLCCEKSVVDPASGKQSCPEHGTTSFV
jgi:hypothetical protein